MGYTSDITTDPASNTLKYDKDSPVMRKPHLPSAHDNETEKHPKGQELSSDESVADKGTMRQLMDAPQSWWHISTKQFQLHKREA